MTLGVFILWFGWLGFNGGSQLAIGSAADVLAMSHVLVNTNLAGAAGVIAAIAVSRPILGRIDLLAGLNGAIAGLVSIGVFAFTTSWLTWLALDRTMGVRVSTEVEQMGQDVAELGIDAYPEFVLMPDQDE